jgi:hypothetical protein
MSGVVKGIGKVAKFAAPFASVIPGIGPIAAAGLGAAGGLLGGPGGTRATTETGIDPFLDPFRRDLLSRSQALAGQPFDPASIQPFMNPFQSGVEDATVADFARQRAQLGNSVDDLATKAGAFGGSRHAVLQARGLAEIGQNEASTLAGLRYSGFNDAMTRAMQYPFQQLGFYGNVLSGVPQSQSLTTNQRETGGGLNRALGGAVAGLSLYDLLRGRRKPSGGGTPAIGGGYPPFSQMGY